LALQPTTSFQWEIVLHYSLTKKQKMKNAEAVLSVKFKTSLSGEQLGAVCQEDLEAFRQVPGLIQKYYLAEEKTGAINGLYIFETTEDRSCFWASGLAKSIPARYGIIPETLRVEEFEMLIVLNDMVTI
jgi:hypothetical protein